jgi:hypothetical protein
MRVKAFALALFGVLLFLSACKKPSPTEGGDYFPSSDELTALQTDTFSIVATTMKEDSVFTDELSLALVGMIDNPTFGTTQCVTYTQLRLSALEPDVSSAMVVDSVILSLAYNATAYGKPDRQSFSIRQLSQPLFKDSVYSARKTWPTYPHNLIVDGEEIQDINVTSLVPLGQDTLSPQLRLPLDKQLGYLLLQPQDAAVLSSQLEFQNYFHGIAIESKARYDGVARYDLIDPATHLTVYYRDVVNGLADTLSYDFVVTTDCARYNEFRHDYQGTELAEFNNGTTKAGGEYFYVQTGAGLKTKFTFPHLLDLNQFQDQVVNRAELIIPIDPDAVYAEFDQLYLRYLEDGNLKPLPDENVQVIGGNYNASTHQYSFNISRYVQSVLTGELPNRPLYLMGGTSGVSVKGIRAHGPQYNLDKPTENTRLVVTFAH